MYIKRWNEYINSFDKTKIPVGSITEPSKNCNIIQGSIKSDYGNQSVFVNPNIQSFIHSEYTFEVSGREIPIRCYVDKNATTMQIKFDTTQTLDFTDFLTNLNPDRIFFTTWVDLNNIPIKRRLVFADNLNMYIWSGAFASVSSKAENILTLDNTRSVANYGFDTPTTNIPVFVYRNNVKQNININYTAIGLNTMTVNDASQIQEGDIIVQAPTTQAGIPTLFKGSTPQVVWNLQNHIFVFNQNSVYSPYSNARTFNVDTGFDFTVPSQNATITSGGFINLDKTFQAVQNRRGQMLISDTDTWYKLSFTNQLPDGTFLSIEKYEAGYNKGSMFMATTSYLGDIVYIGLDKSVYFLTLNELGTLDNLLSLSYNKIDNYLENANFTNTKLYFYNRILYFLFPNDNEYITYDTFEKHWNPPRELNIAGMFVFGGVLYGNSNVSINTFERFIGQTDFGVDIRTFVNTGYMYQGDINSNNLRTTMQQFTFQWHGILFKSDIGNTIQFGLNLDSEWEPKFRSSTYITSPQYMIQDDNLNTFGDTPFGTDIFGSAGDKINSDLNYRFRKLDRPISGQEASFDLQMFIISEKRIELLEYNIDYELADNNENYDNLWITK